MSKICVFAIAFILFCFLFIFDLFANICKIILIKQEKNEEKC